MQALQRIHGQARRRGDGNLLRPVQSVLRSFHRHLSARQNRSSLLGVGKQPQCDCDIWMDVKMGNFCYFFLLLGFDILVDLHWYMVVFFTSKLHRVWIFFPPSHHWFNKLKGATVVQGRGCGGNECLRDHEKSLSLVIINTSITFFAIPPLRWRFRCPFFYHTLKTSAFDHFFFVFPSRQLFSTVREFQAISSLSSFLRDTRIKIGTRTSPLLRTAR